MHWAVFPDPSSTVQVTSVVPNEYGSTASLVVPDTLQLSAVTGVPSATPDAVHLSASTFTVTSAGLLNDATISDSSATFRLHCVVIPDPSSTVQVTSVV